MRLLIICLLISVAREATSQIVTGGLARRAELQFRMQAPNANRPGALVTFVEPAGLAARAGLRVGDVVVRLNDIPLSDAITYSRALNELRGRVPVRITALRAGTPIQFRYTPLAWPLEQHPASEVDYGQLVTPLRHGLRTIVTKPKGKSGRLPAVLLVPWLSCSSVEVAQAEDGVDQLVHQFAQSSTHLFMRVEKPGVGDSEGPACVDCDLQTELAGYRHALVQLKQRPDVDTNQIYLLGISLGASLAPLVGAGQPIKGYLVTGACMTTWLEHMLALERRRLALSGETPGQINAKMGGYATLYQRYYVEKMTPQTVINQQPHLSSLWYDAPAHQYGRPAAFYHQLQDLNIEAAWSAVRVPTLVIYGEYDWIMSLPDHQRIVQLVNSNQAGLVSLIVLPKANHNLARFTTAQEAFSGTAGRLPDDLQPIVADWLSRH